MPTVARISRDMSSKVKKRTLIHDIASHLDVSIATVSLVLNGKARQSRIVLPTSLIIRQSSVRSPR